jgi:lysyl-tRNA synthetase class 2
VRGFFAARDFVEIDVPQLIVAPTTEPHIDPLAVELTPGVDEPPTQRFLHTSPEIALKRALAHGVERTFSLGHVFRDGERTAQHLPEFTLLEWYRAGEGTDALITDCEQLLGHVAAALDGAAREDTHAAPQVAPNISAPFDRTTVAALFDEHAQVDLLAALLRACARPDTRCARGRTSRTRSFT